MNNDLYLRAAIETKEQPIPPNPSAVVDTLIRMAHLMSETAFQWTFFDRPRAGTSALVFHDQSRPSWPTDGIRYAQQEKPQRTTHVWPPLGIGIELETCILAQGMYPPSNPSVPLPQDTPELILARYRVRWRIVTPGIGNPNLCLVYWGRDDRITARAPPGWERQPIRQYPLPPINETPQYPLKAFQAVPQVVMALQKRMPAQPPPPAGPTAQGLPLQGQRPVNQPGPGQPLPNAATMRASLPPTNGSPAAVHATPGRPTQMLPPQQQGGPMPPSQAPPVRALASHFNFPAPFADPYDILSDRSRAGLRYEYNHALVAPIFDPSSTTELLTGWKTPSFPDIQQIKAQIAELEADVAKLRSVTAPPKASFEALLAPLPEMMSIVEMRDGAMQAYNTRRQQAEQEQAAKDEEVRKVREAEEEELRRKKADEDAKLATAEAERRKAEEAEQERLRQEQEREAAEKAAAEPTAQTQPAEEPAAQALEASSAQPEDEMEMLVNTHDDYGDGQGNEGDQQGQPFEDDAYLFSNNFSSYDPGMMEQSLFELEYLNQMGEEGM